MKRRKTLNKYTHDKKDSVIDKKSYNTESLSRFLMFSDMVNAGIFNQNQQYATNENCIKNK